MNQEKNLKSERLNIRIGADFKSALKKAADAENRSLANFVITVLQERLDKKYNQLLSNKE